MMTVTGSPAAKVGRSNQICEAPDISVPAPCAACRQVARYLPRTMSWAKPLISRFRSIVEAILKEHDDILASLCGFCGVQDAPDCDCFTLQFRALGLPTKIVTRRACGDCLTISQTIEIPVVCYTTCDIGCDIPCAEIVVPDTEMPSCWRIECGYVGADCILVDLDPCNNPEHLAVMTRAYSVATQHFNSRATGPNLIDAMSQLFVGSVPQIIRAEFGAVYVTLGRPLSELERTYIPFFKSLLPLGFGVSLFIVTPCSISAE